jgi:hypothetical protein
VEKNVENRGFWCTGSNSARFFALFREAKLENAVLSRSQALVRCTDVIFGTRSSGESRPKAAFVKK